MKSYRLVALFLAFVSCSASAEIIILQEGEYSLQYGVPQSVIVVPSRGASMSSIVITQPIMVNSPMVQRAHAWSTYQKNNNASGRGLVWQPYLGANSDAQLGLYRNMSRAHAFRLGY